MNGGQLIQVARRIPSTFRQQHGTCEHRIRPIRGMIIQTAGSQTILSGRVGGGAQTHGGLFVRHVDEMGHGLQAAFVGSRGAHRCLARRHRFQCAVLECKCDCARTLCGCHATHDKAYSRPSGESTQTNLDEPRRIGCRDSSIDHIVTVSSPTMHPRTSRIRPDMARTASSNSTKPRKSKDNGSTHDGETKVQPELDLEPEPLWKKILLAIPRAFGSGVRAVTGVGEYDPATVVTVCASCCSCSPYCSARPNGSASAVHSASCFTPSRPVCLV